MAVIEKVEAVEETQAGAKESEEKATSTQQQERGEGGVDPVDDPFANLPPGFKMPPGARVSQPAT